MEDHPDLRRNDSVVIDRFNLTVTDYSRGFANWFEVTVGPEIPRTMDVDGDGEEEDLPQQ